MPIINAENPMKNAPTLLIKNPQSLLKNFLSGLVRTAFMMFSFPLLYNKYMWILNVFRLNNRYILAGYIHDA